MNILRDKKTNRVAMYSEKKFEVGSFDPTIFETVEGLDAENLDKGMIVSCKNSHLEFSETPEMKKISNQIAIEKLIIAAKALKKPDDAIKGIFSVLEKQWQT
jgi:hypothetical protein